jgi:hypothetical protein
MKKGQPKRAADPGGCQSRAAVAAPVKHRYPTPEERANAKRAAREARFSPLKRITRREKEILQAACDQTHVPLASARRADHFFEVASHPAEFAVQLRRLPRIYYIGAPEPLAQTHRNPLTTQGACLLDILAHRPG